MQLKKVLTLRTVVATSAGLTLASSSFIAAVQVAGFMAGDSAWLAILAGGVLCMAAALCFGELNGLLPSAAGIRLYFGRAFGDRVALVVSLLYMAVVLGVIGAESYVLANVLSDAIPVVPPLVWITVLMVAVTVMNLRGIKIAGNFQDVITYGLLLSLMGMALYALWQVDFKLETPFSPGGAVDLINAIAVGVFLYVGFEWVTPLAEEVTHSRLISRGMLLAVGVLSVTYALFTVAMTAAVPKGELASSPMPQMVFARSVLGDAGAAWMVVLALASSVTTFNAGLISVSRFFYAAAREHVLPPVFSRLSTRYFTPWVAIITLFFIGFGIAVAVLLTGRYLVLVNVAAAMESIVYVMAGLAVVVLRRKMSGFNTSFRAPGGLLIPAVTVLTFTLLTVAIFAEFLEVLVLLGSGGLICWLYVVGVVPVLKKKYRRPERERVSRRRRSATAESSAD